MVRRIGVIFLSMSLILGAVAAQCPALRIIQDSSLSDEGWRELSYIPLPQEYKDYKWSGGCDFAHLRDVEIDQMKTGQTVMFVGLAVSMSMLCAAAVKWFAAKLFGEAAVIAAGEKATHWDKLRGGAEAATGSAAGTVAAFGVEKGLGKVLGLIGINLEWPQTVTDQVRFLETELGISDYYFFGAAKAWVSEVTLPLGTRMELRIGSSEDYYNMGYPPGEFRIIYDSWPRVIRLMSPELDFKKLDARVWERDITGKLQLTTVDCVFPYEVVEGKAFPFSKKGKSPGLPVHPDTPQKGGKIVGKVSLNYLLPLGVSGLREVHVCSPVNEGVWAKKLDDYAFAIVINRKTVSATPSKEELNVGEELIVSVKIGGFHPAKATIRASDGKVYPWEDWAGAILRGASLQGAGITETEMKHERERTILKGTPQEPGKVKLVLSTRDGPVVWEVATVEKKSLMRLGFLTEDDCPSPPEPNLYLFKAHVEYDAEVNVDCLECKYGLFNGEKPRRYGEEQRPWVASLFGWTKANLFAFDSIEKAKKMFTEAKPELREQIEEEIRKQREDPGGGPPLEVKWDESDPDALIGECIDSSVADRKGYMKVGWFRYENCFFIIGTHKDRDQDWVRRVFDKLKKDLEALVDRKGHEDRPPA